MANHLDAGSPHLCSWSRCSVDIEHFFLWCCISVGSVGTLCTHTDSGPGKRFKGYIFSSREILNHLLLMPLINDQRYKFPAQPSLILSSSYSSMLWCVFRISHPLYLSGQLGKRHQQYHTKQNLWLVVPDIRCCVDEEKLQLSDYKFQWDVEAS